MTEKIYSFRGKNGKGRHGWAIAAPAETSLPAEGTLTQLGRIDGLDTYRFSPGPTGQWLLVSTDCVVIDGGQTIARVRVRPGRVRTILLLGEQATVRYYGYRRRHSWIRHYVRGEWSGWSKPTIANERKKISDGRRHAI